MRIHFAPRLFAALVASALLAACGGNPTSGTSVLPSGTSGTQSAVRAVDSASAAVATPTPTPRPPCYCPPHQRICSDIACLTTNDASRAVQDAAKAAAATPKPTPYPPCYCPPSRVPHACPDCAVTNLSIPGVTAGDARVASLVRRARYARTAA